MNTLKKVTYLYRCGGNWKDHYTFYAPADAPIKVGEEVTMGQHGTPTQEAFFDGVHPHAYDERFDHNLLEVEEVEEVDASEASYDVLDEYSPRLDEGEALVDCDWKLSDSPYSEEQIQALAKENRVWTAVDGDNDKTFIRAGLALVNRFAIYVTEKPFPPHLKEVF